MMKASSQDNVSNTNSETKTAELVILLDGLRIDPSILHQSHEVLGEASSSRNPLNEGIRARIRLRNNPETLRSMLRSQSLRVSKKNTMLHILNALYYITDQEHS